MSGFLHVAVCLTFLLLTLVCASRSPLQSSGERKKITFDIDAIDENGLIGPADGKRSVAYEFCIPRDSARQKEVLTIDSSVKFFTGASGRIGCDTEQYLCIGEGGTRVTLLKLAALDYITRIDPFYGE